MRREKHLGHTIICGHIFPASELHVGQRWMGQSGQIVRISSIDTLGWVTYVWTSEDGSELFEKDAFSFQCRYSLIVD